MLFKKKVIYWFQGYDQSFCEESSTNKCKDFVDNLQTKLRYKSGK